MAPGWVVPVRLFILMDKRVKGGSTLGCYWCGPKASANSGNRGDGYRQAAPPLKVQLPQEYIEVVSSGVLKPSRKEGEPFGPARIYPEAH